MEGAILGELEDEKESGIFQSIRFWQGWAVAATAGALFAFVANAEFPVAGHAPDYVAVIGEPDKPVWVLNADLRAGVIEVRAAGAPAADDGERYALWLSAGNVNERLGTLPTNRDRAVYKLAKTTRTLLGHRKSLGVASEPADETPPERTAEAPAWLWRATIVRL